MPCPTTSASVLPMKFVFSSYQSSSILNNRLDMSATRILLSITMVEPARSSIRLTREKKTLRQRKSNHNAWAM